MLNFKTKIKLQICTGAECPLCDSNHIKLESGTISLTKCVKTIQRTRRTSQHRYLCAAYVADSCQTTETIARNTCPLVPTIMNPTTSRLLAYECCQQKLFSEKKTRFECRGAIDKSKSKVVKL